MRVVVGLGNPGSRYVDTRHNVGFVVVEELACRWHVSLPAPGPDVRMTSARVGGEMVRLIEPYMYMNLSGEALTMVEPLPRGSELIVAHDDIDLECGRVHIKHGGGTAGHRGLASIVAHFGEDFTRVRIGVGRPPTGQDAASFVLSAFDAEEREVIKTAVRRAADAVECILRDGEQAAMSIFNRRPDTADAASAALMGRA